MNKQQKKPTLILCGDILELALCTTDKAAMAFERFIELSMEKDNELFERILYIPGNHDHHLWETAREIQYQNDLKYTAPRYEFPEPWHITKLFEDKQNNLVPSPLLTGLMQRFEHLKDEEVNIFYPNLGIRNKENSKCIILTHGHYIDSIYKLMTTLKEMLFSQKGEILDMHKLEGENFSWIDFFWSTMGRSGQMGQHIEFIYEKMQYRKGLEEIIENFSENLAERFDIPYIPGEWAEARALNFLIKKLISGKIKTERPDTGDTLSQKGEKGLRDYITGPLYKQIIEEIELIPQEMTFIFGHTHKPFQKDMKSFKGYSRWINVYNTGGWVVDTLEPEFIHGASMILIDDEFNATSIRMYNEAEDSTDYRVSVQEATHGSSKRNPFHDQIDQIIDPEKEPWINFSRKTAEVVRERSKNLKDRVKDKGYID